METLIIALIIALGPQVLRLTQVYTWPLDSHGTVPLPFLGPQFEEDTLPDFMASVIVSQSLMMNVLLSIS